MSWKRIGFIAAALLAAMLLAACAPAATPATKSAEPIKIGFLSGIGSPVLASYYKEMTPSLELARDEINAKGGVLGRKIELVVADDAGKPDQTAINVERLVTQDKVVAFISPASAPNVLAAGPLFEKYQVPDMIDIGSTNELTQQGWKYVFRTGDNVDQRANSAINFLKSLSPKPQTVLLLNENRSFGVSSWPSFKKYGEAAGFKMLGNESYDATALDFKPLLLRAKAQNPDVVIVAGFTNDDILIAKQSAEIGLKPKVWLGFDGGTSQVEWLEGAGATVENVFVVHAWYPVKQFPASMDFAENYRKTHNGKEPQQASVVSYAALYILADAIQRAGSTDGPKLRDALEKTDLKTAYAQHKFDSNHDNVGFQNVVVQIQKGKRVAVFPDQYAEGKAIYPIP
ncbi:MAG: ABC transporter substrate-binding protein [Dehalococcoidia bacterium]|nr:ABC transporter substrate-binding protein [Dehalococcoidia bacterium]